MGRETAVSAILDADLDADLGTSPNARRDVSPAASENASARDRGRSKTGRGGGDGRATSSVPGNQDEAIGAKLAALAQTLVARIASHPEQQRELLGQAFLACEQLLESRPDEFSAAARDGWLAEWCLPHVRRALSDSTCDSAHHASGGRPRGGWLGTYVRPDGRDVEPEDAYAGADPEASRLSQQAFERAVSLAREEGQATMLRNLQWYRARLEHKTYEAIAREEDRVPATVRTGVARAKKFVLRIVHQLRHAQPAPLSGTAPPAIEPLRALWVHQELEALERELLRIAPQYRDDPHWINLRALLAAERGNVQDARALYERALIVADAAPLRARLLNNLANLADDLGEGEEAQTYWQRASQLAPRAPAPLLNLFAAASARCDYPSAQHFAALLGELLSSGHLSREERSYVCRRLRENPKLDWVRDTELWRMGPARWIRAAGVGSRPSGSSRPALQLVRRAAAVLALLVCVLPVGVSASPTSRANSVEARDSRSAAAATGLLAGAQADKKGRGGDSMGSPADRGNARDK